MLSKIQTELKAPKGQMNKFGGYRYRSCEDILEALKPLLAKHKSSLTISDEIVLIGDRYYIKATATYTDADNNQVAVTAYAREELTKKGMDASQITGAASSYARKYALNGLFAIDDTKDADATNDHKEETFHDRLTKQQRDNIENLIEVTKSDREAFYSTATAQQWTYEYALALFEKKKEKVA